MMDFVLRGNIIYSEDKDRLSVTENGYAVCVGGVSKGVFETLPEEYAGLETVDCGGKLIVPGFVDLHVHAPQYGFRSVGMDCELLEWLNRHAFPEESKFSDTGYAAEAYKIFVDDLVSGFTSRACVFGTLHREATAVLAGLIEKSGLKAMVGKVNMDRNSPDYLREKSWRESVSRTEEYIDELKGFKNVRPIITPRFVPSCTDELMEGLKGIIEKTGLPVQSHLSENPEEIAWVKELCPDCPTYGDVYDKYGMLSASSIMAHCVHLTEREINLLKDRGAFVAHCPESNMNLASGIAPVSRLLHEGINVGLGSDVAGGTTLSIPAAMTLAVQNSKIYWRYIDNKYPPLRLENVFYLATEGGGKFFGKAGSFKNGYEFDALVLDDSNIKTTVDFSVRERLERLIYLGGRSNIVSKYVSGVKIF